MIFIDVRAQREKKASQQHHRCACTYLCSTCAPRYTCACVCVDRRQSQRHEPIFSDDKSPGGGGEGEKTYQCRQLYLSDLSLDDFVITAKTLLNTPESLVIFSAFLATTTPGTKWRPQGAETMKLSYLMSVLQLTIIAGFKQRL